MPPSSPILFVSLGSLVAVGVWLLFSLLFSLYVTNFGCFNRIYRTLAGLVILLLGAEMDRIFEAHAPGGKRAHGRPTRGKISE